MSVWLVTVATGGAFHYGPSVVVEAASAVEAARLGMDKLRREDSTYGIECSHCGEVAVEQVAVFAFEQAEMFMQHTMWGAAGAD